MNFYYAQDNLGEKLLSKPGGFVIRPVKFDELEDGMKSATPGTFDEFDVYSLYSINSGPSFPGMEMQVEDFETIRGAINFAEGLESGRE